MIFRELKRCNHRKCKETTPLSARFGTAGEFWSRCCRQRRRTPSKERTPLKVIDVGTIFVNEKFTKIITLDDSSEVRQKLRPSSELDQTLPRNKDAAAAGSGDAPRRRSAPRSPASCTRPVHRKAAGSSYRIFKDKRECHRKFEKCQ